MLTVTSAADDDNSRFGTPFPVLPLDDEVDCPSTLNVTVVVTVKLFCDRDSMLFCCEMGLIVGVGVLEQRGGGAGGVRIGIRLSVFGGVGRGALTPAKGPEAGCPMELNAFRSLAINKLFTFAVLPV